MFFVDKNLKILGYKEIESRIHFVACFDKRQDARIFVKAKVKKNEKEKSNK